MYTLLNLAQETVRLSQANAGRRPKNNTPRDQTYASRSQVGTITVLLAFQGSDRYASAARKFGGSCGSIFMLASGVQEDTDALFQEAYVPFAPRTFVDDLSNIFGCLHRYGV
jgi:hypothetical protein